MKHLISFLAYLGFGVALHAFMVGPTLDPTSALTIGWIAGWPILLIALGFKWFLIVAFVIAFCVGLWLFWDNLWFRLYRKQVSAGRELP